MPLIVNGVTGTGEIMAVPSGTGAGNISSTAPLSSPSPSRDRESRHDRADDGRRRLTFGPVAGARRHLIHAGRNAGCGDRDRIPCRAFVFTPVEFSGFRSFVDFNTNDSADTVLNGTAADDTITVANDAGLGNFRPSRQQSRR